MTYALIACDPQYDYLPGGSLQADNSLEAVQNLARLAGSADLVVVTRDWHPPDHSTFQDHPPYDDWSWPPHCVQNTKGAKIFPAIRKRADYVISKGVDDRSEEYSAFAGKTLRPVQRLEEILLADGQGPDQIVVGGFLLETTVRYTAFDANAIGGWEVIIPLNCCGTLRLFDAERIDQLERVGIKVVDTWNAS